MQINQKPDEMPSFPTFESAVAPRGGRHARPEVSGFDIIYIYEPNPDTAGRAWCPPRGATADLTSEKQPFRLYFGSDQALTTWITREACVWVAGAAGRGARATVARRDSGSYVEAMLRRRVQAVRRKVGLGRTMRLRGTNLQISRGFSAKKR